MRFLSRNLVTVLLIVVMAMPALSSPALRHSHADGDRSHDHRVVHHGHSHGPNHSHSSRHHHRHHHTDAKTAKHSHDGDEAHSAMPPVEHYHVFWFGFATSLPLSAPERSDSPRAISKMNQWVPLVSEFRLPDAAQDGSSLVAVDHCTPTGLTPRLPNRSEAHPPQTSAMVLLCDTARRERSGVLVV